MEVKNVSKIGFSTSIRFPKEANRGMCKPKSSQEKGSNLALFLQLACWLDVATINDQPPSDFQRKKERKREGIQEKRKQIEN